MIFAEWLLLRLSRGPGVLRVIFDVLRARQPVLRTGSTFWVTGGREVLEVLGRGHDFVTGPVHGPKVRLPPTLLAMEPCPEYFRQRTDVTAALQAQAERYLKIVERRSQAAAQAWDSQRGGARDLVAAFSEAVVADSAAEFYGIPVRDFTSRYLDTEPGPATFRVLLRRLTAVVFAPHPAPFAIGVLADALSAELRQLLERALREAETANAGQAQDPATAERTVLQRLAEHCRSELDRHALIGQLSGMLLAEMVLAKAFTQIVHEILARPQVREAVGREAQRQGDPATLRLYALEALRFRPAFPMLPRYCIRDTTLAPRSARERALPAGANLVVSLLGALFDAEIVERPLEFAPERFAPTSPQQRALRDLLFGAGIHNCIGRFKAEAALPIMLRALFQHPELQGAAPGRFEYEGLSIAAYRLPAPSRGARA